MEKLNIPLGLIERYKASKQRKELLAFAVGVKCLHSNSVLTEVSPRKVMNLFHVSQAKAKRLIEDAKNDVSLFDYSAKENSLKASTWKDETIKQSRIKGMKYKSDFCYKLTKSAYTLKELTHKLTLILIGNAINAVERNNLIKGQTNSGCVRGAGLTQQKLANIAGTSRSEVQRIISYLYEAGTINKTSAHGKMVIPFVTAETVAEWRKQSGRKYFILNPKDNSGWVVFPCSYSIEDRKETESYKHVIYTHKKRIEAFNQSPYGITNTGSFYDNPVNAAWT